jgi:hypothetical protein
MLTIMRQFLDNQRYVYVMMDGTTSVGSRQTIIKDFNEVMIDNVIVMVMVMMIVLGSINIYISNDNTSWRVRS